MIVEVFVEAAKGSRIDDQSHSIAIGRRFPRGARYPADYGFMPWTLAEDQNPLEVVVITDEPSFPGRQLWCRAIAVLWMTDDRVGPMPGSWRHRSAASSGRTSTRSRST